MEQHTHQDETGRVCTKCNIYKLWSEFNKTKPNCRDCQKAYEATYVRDKQKAKEAIYKWYHANKCKGNCRLCK